MRKHADLDCRTEGLTPSSRRGSIATAAIVGVVTLLSAGATPSGNAEPRPKAALEENYILRSIREPHEPVASWCAPSKTGFEPFPKDAERFFSFWSLRSGPDGRVVHTKQARAAELRACFGATSEPARQNFYAEIKLGSISFRGDGECLALKIDFPDAGLFPVRCQLVLTGLPAPYVGGLLTTNTITSRAAFGGDTDPPGYTRPRSPPSASGNPSRPRPPYLSTSTLPAPGTAKHRWGRKLAWFHTYGVA